MSGDTSILPPELITTPQPLIGLCGLDIVKNSIHKSIWDAFNNNRKIDRAPIQFTLLPNNYEFPVSKPKRQSYEWYQPKGILKRNWLIKHLNILPAVIVLFQDIEWNDPSWSDKQLQCASLMQSLKNSLQRRNTRLAIVLLQKGSPLPPGEDLLATERAANLTNVCDINSKMLFILPHNDHLMGYTLRLESAFLEFAQSYYSQMAKQVRVHRDQLTSAHQTLRIRHQFKLGFITEMRLDYNTALKHYTQAYTNLEDIRIIDTNCLEIKTVAGYINYKMCKLMFKLNMPRDSITQFKIHMDKYRNRTGFKELLFEHYAWISVQYSSFGELFCEAIKNGLPALQTQHPGIYFHKAAEYIGKRKESLLQCSAHSLSPMESPYGMTDTGNNSNNYDGGTGGGHVAVGSQQMVQSVFQNEFVGVRGTKTTSEPMTEQQIISLVQENEKHFNHSAAIIALLSQAMAQFKFYKCLRFRKKLAIDMAEEYLKCGDHSKALTLFSLMLSDFRIDKWYTIFTEVLLKTLRSAYLSASVSDFISCSIEAISPIINIDKSERIILLENLWKVFQNVPPISQMQIAPELRTNWEIALTNFKSPVIIDLDKINSLFDCIVSFRKPKVHYDESIELDLFIRSKSCIPLKLRDFTILFSDTKLNFKLKGLKYTEITLEYLLELNKYRKNNFNNNKTIINNTATHNYDDDDHQMVNNTLNNNHDDFKLITEDFMLEPEKYYRIIFYVEDYQFTENVELRILRLEMTMGVVDKQYAILQQSASHNQLNHFKNYNRKYDCIENISVYNSCYIIPTFHITIQNNLDNQPMLVNEYFKVISTISNSYDISLQNVGVSITVPLHLINKVFLTSDLKIKQQKLVSHLQIDIGDVHFQSNTSISYYLISLIEGNIDLIQKIYYQSEQMQNVSISKKLTSKSSVLKIESPSTLTPTSSSSASVSMSSSLSTTMLSSSTAMAMTASTTGISNIMNKQQQLHNINIEYITNESVRKLKEDIIIIPCIEEFNLIGKFYTLNHKPLTRAFRNEDFLLRIDIEIKSNSDIEILDMYLMCDHNISEKSYTKQRRKYNYTDLNDYHSSGQKLRDIKILNANNCTSNWINKLDYLEQKSKHNKFELFSKKKLNCNNTNNIIKNDNMMMTSMTTMDLNSYDNIANNTNNNNNNNNDQQADYFKTNLLSKIPINATIIGNSTNNVLLSTTVQQQPQQITKSLKDDNLKLLKTSLISPTPTNNDNLLSNNAINDNNNNNNLKLIYNKSIDAFHITEHCKGFLRGKIGYENNALPIFGVYCIKWRRNGFMDENESKFLITGIEIIEPPLNIYCYIDDKMYVKIPMTLKITIVNPTRNVMHLMVTLKNSENFMFSGHTQLNISILSNASYNLSFNLYPLKSGWQILPELEIKYSNIYNTDNTQSLIDDANNQQQQYDEQNFKLQQLVNRWMPKKVFILPMLRHIK